MHVVAFEVDVGIDFVGDGGAIGAALIVLEADVVGGGADPEGFAIYGERGFPETQVIAGGYDLDWFGVGPAVVLGASEEVEGAHGHGQIGFFGHAGHDAGEERFFDVGVNFHPASGLKGFFHGGLRAEDQEVDHVAGSAGFVGDAAGDFGEKRIVDARDGRIRCARRRRRSWRRGRRFGFHFIGAFGGVAGGLVDADGEAAGGGCDEVALGADQERIRKVFIANAADQRAAAGVVEGEDAEKIFEAAG